MVLALPSMGTVGGLRLKPSDPIVSSVASGPRAGDASAKSAVVVGSGIAGMTAALRLKQAGFSVRVLEAEAVVGGRVSCRRVGGYTFNRASTLLAGDYGFLVGLIGELGLRDRLEYRNFRIGTLRDGKVHSLRTDHMMRDSLFSGLLGWRSKLLMMRVLRDAKRAHPYLDYGDLGKAAPLDIESARDYALRCLNQELLDYVVDPAMAAMLATTAERPSVVDFLFAIAHYIGMGAYSYDGGIDFIIDELVRRIPVETDARVLSVVEKEDAVEVIWERSGHQHSVSCTACVIAVGAREVPRLYPQLSPKRREILDGYDYSSIIVGHFALSSPPDIDADFIQIPPCEIPGLVNMYFPHRVGKGAVPPGKGMAVCYFSDDWSKARMSLDDDAVVADMIPLVERVIPDIRHRLQIANVERWPQALFLSRPGVYKTMAAFRDAGVPNARVQLAGDYYSFTSMNASAISGDMAARDVLAMMSMRA